MSDEGGESEKELKDFDCGTSAVDESLRARVERAESDSINRMIALGENEKSEKRFRSLSRVRIATMTIFGTLFGVCFIFVVVLFAMRVGGLDFFNEAPKEKESSHQEYYSLSFQEKSLLYGLSGKEAKEEGTHLLESFGEGEADGYVLISRKAALERLQTSFNKLSGTEQNFAELLSIDEGFFDSGVVIAVVVEDPYVASLQTIEMSRDDKYSLSLELKRTNLSREGYEYEPALAGYLNLIKVDNVRPREITIYIDNN